MKYLTFFVTFFAFLSIHIMRMSYSFNKSYIKQRFCIESSLLAFFDAIIYLGLGIGFFFRYKIIYGENLFLTYLKMTIIVALSFSFIPLASLYGFGTCSNSVQQNNSNILIKILMTISLLSFGFFQFAHWPIVLTLVSRYFNEKNEGAQLGCWSATGDIGNIAGFMLGAIIVIYLKGSWQLSMILSSICAIIMSFCVYFCINENKNHQNRFNIQELQQNQNGNLSIQNEIQEKDKKYFNDINQTSFSQFLQFIQHTIHSLQNCLYLISTALYKSILYGFLLWSPIFLVSVGFKEFSGSIPIIFNLSTLFGSIALGQLYEIQSKYLHKSNLQQTNQFRIVLNKIIKYKIFVFSIFLLFFLVLFIIVKQNVWVYSIIAFFMGFFLGGIFNVLITHEVMKITDHDSKRSDLMTTLTMSIGNILVGCLQLIISFVLHSDNSQHLPQTSTKTDFFLKQFRHSTPPHQPSPVNHHYMSVFVILLITGAIATLISFIRIFRSIQSQQQDKQNNDKQLK